VFPKLSQSTGEGAVTTLNPSHNKKENAMNIRPLYTAVATEGCALCRFLFLLVIGCLLTCPARAAYVFTTVDDPSGVDGSALHAIDGNNIVGGYYDYSTPSVMHGFLFNGSTYTTLDDPLGLGGTVPQGIFGNNVVGTYYVPISTCTI